MSNEEKINELEKLQSRLYTEDNELFEKIMKLEDFINTIRRTKI